MTTPQPHDRITTHPEYARSYQHYIDQGSNPEDAARQAYQWTTQHLAATPTVKGKGKGARVAIGVAIAVIALCGIGGIAAALSSGDEKARTTGDKPAAKPDAPEPKKAGIGTPARDGNFEFTVTGVKCGATKVGSEFLNKQAQGQFCMVSMTVKNVKKEPQMFDASSQKAFAADGAQFGADAEAGLYANEGTKTFLNEINPGNQVSGVVVFDVPKTGKLSRLELHDSLFSGGVEVAVD